jgi:hypothetical protein
MQTEQPPAQVGNSVEQCVVIDIGDEWVHDGGADRAGEHGRLDASVQAGIAQQHAIQTIHKALERHVFGQQPNHDGIELQRPHQPAIADRHLDHAYQQRIAGFGPISVRLGFLERRTQPTELALGDRDDDLVLGPELVVDSGFRDPYGIRDHLQRRCADAVLGEQVQRGIKYARPRWAVLDDPQLPVGDRLSCCFHTTRLDDGY